MTPLRVNVEGGTDAGKREPFQGNAPEWECGCYILVCRDGETDEPLYRVHPGYLARCADCGAART